MSPLRHVEGHRAGPSALGILVPPGRRTSLILRPRSLSWDLLLLRPDAASTFRELPRGEANTLAHKVYQALESWSKGATNHVEEVACPEGHGFWVRVRVGSFVMLACARRPGQPYQPCVFADAETARSAAEKLLAVLCPREDVEQEVYLNTRHFSR